MRLFTLPIKIPDTANQSVVQLTRDIQDKWLQISTAFTGSLAIEVSFDGVYFFGVGSAITAPGLYQIPQPAFQIRVRVAAMSGTPPKAVLAGWSDNG